MQQTIDAQAAEMTKREQASNSLLTSYKEMMVIKDTAVQERDEALRKVTEMECQAKEAADMRTKVAALTAKLARVKVESFKEGAASMRPVIRRAYEKAFPDADYDWFDRRLLWADVAVAAEAIRQSAPEMEESEGEEVDDLVDDVAPTADAI